MCWQSFREESLCKLSTSNAPAILGNISKGELEHRLQLLLCKNGFVDTESSRNDNMSLFELQTSSLSDWCIHLSYQTNSKHVVYQTAAKQKIFLKYLPKSSLYSNSFPWVTYSVNKSRSLHHSCALLGHRVRQSVGLGCLLCVKCEVQSVSHSSSERKW